VDIATVGERTGAAVITLGFVISEDHTTAVGELATIAGQLPGAVEIWIGGGGLRQFGPDEIPARCRILPDLVAFEHQVDALIGRH
jgi:hypothetical protein